VSRIPPSAAPDVQESLRAAWAEIDRLKAAAGNRNAAGSRTINAGDAVDSSDYVTLGQLRRLISDTRFGDDLVLNSLTVNGTATLEASVFIAQLQDAGIVFAKAGGELATDVDNLSWRYTNSSVRLGGSVDLRWHHGAELRSANPGVLEISGEDHDVSAALSRVALGLDDNAHPALVTNGGALDIRRGGPGGALTDLACATLTASNVTQAGGTGKFSTVVIGTDPGGAAFLRVGGDGYINGTLTLRDTTLLHVNGGLGNGAGAGAGTLTNAPAAGDPTKWIPIDDNGTTRYVPAW
jgi:hypothetical protein